MRAITGARSCWWHGNSGIGSRLRSRTVCGNGRSGPQRPSARICSRLTGRPELSKRRYVSSYHMAMIYAGLREKDQAFEWLEKAYQERSDLLVYLKVEPRLDSL